MVSIKDVAEIARVSDRTVSRVVNRETTVAPVTRERVETAIEKLGYIPNRAARLVRTNRSGVVGLVTDVVSTTPFSTDIVRGIHDAIENTPYSLLTANTAGDSERARRCWITLKEHRIEAAIFVTMYHRAVSSDEVDLSVPTVLVNCFSEELNLDSIVPDDYQGGRAAAEAAYWAGHRKFGHIRINKSIPAKGLRESAIRDFMAEVELSVREDWFIDGLEGPVFHDRFVAYDSLLEILGSNDRPTVLLCGNDELALQAYSAANSSGLRVPSDLSIIGFDDFRVISEVVRPALTTIALPYREMGELSVTMISQRVESRNRAAIANKIRCPFVSRQSLGPPPEPRPSNRGQTTCKQSLADELTQG